MEFEINFFVKVVGDNYFDRLVNLGLIYFLSFGVLFSFCSGFDNFVFNRY